MRTSSQGHSPDDLLGYGQLRGPGLPWLNHYHLKQEALGGHHNHSVIHPHTLAVKKRNSTLWNPLLGSGSPAYHLGSGYFYPVVADRYTLLSTIPSGTSHFSKVFDLKDVFFSIPLDPE